MARLLWSHSRSQSGNFRWAFIWSSKASGPPPSPPFTTDLLQWTTVPWSLWRLLAKVFRLDATERGARLRPGSNAVTSGDNKMGVTGLVSHEPTLPESSGHEDQLTEAQLAERAGTPPDQVRLLVELGVLRPEQGMFRSRDLVRLRVLADLKALGVDARSVAKALSSGYLSLGYLENSALKPPQSELSFSQLADELDIPFSTLEKLYIACGLGHPSPEELVRAQDVPIIRAVPVLFGARVSEGEVLRAVRIWAGGGGRVAQDQFRHFPDWVEGAFRQGGRSATEAVEAAVG